MTTPLVLAEINFDAAPSVTNRFHLDDPVFGVLDTSTLAEADTWEDVASWLMEFSCQRGTNETNAPILRHEAGTGTARLLNDDRRFDPANLAGPYVSVGITQVEPLRLLRIRAIWNHITYDIFHGFIDWRYAYQGPNHDSAMLELTDGFEVINTPRLATGSQGGGELSGARVTRILNSVDWPAADRDIDPGSTTLQATTLEGDALDELHLVTDTEIGELYVDGANVVVFRDRHAPLTDTRSIESQATFGSDIAGGELPYVTVGITYERPVANIVQITREGGTVQTAQAPARYPRTYQRTGLLMETDTAAANYAAWILGMSKDPEFRFSSITIDPRAMPDQLYPQVLGRRIGDRITVVRRPPGGGDPIERDVFIRGIAHTYGPGRWLTVWSLQSATKYAFFVLDNAILGELDANRLAY